MSLSVEESRDGPLDSGDNPPSSEFTGDGHVVPEPIVLRRLVSEALEHS